MPFACPCGGSAVSTRNGAEMKVLASTCQKRQSEARPTRMLPSGQIRRASQQSSLWLVVPPSLATTYWHGSPAGERGPFPQRRIASRCLQLLKSQPATPELMAGSETWVCSPRPAHTGRRWVPELSGSRALVRKAGSGPLPGIMIPEAALETDWHPDDSFRPGRDAAEIVLSSDSVAGERHRTCRSRCRHSDDRQV